jgi:CheY-like chemotaxis protein
MDLTVIIVDDDPIVLFLHEILIKNGGLSDHPVCFPGAIETLDYLVRHQAEKNLYLILLDINMSEMSGWELLDLIEAQLSSKGIYTIMVTSSVDRADHEKIKNYHHVIGYLEKPLNAEVINAMIRSEAFKEISKFKV